jgi:hypothetical protein
MPLGLSLQKSLGYGTRLNILIPIWFEKGIHENHDICRCFFGWKAFVLILNIRFRWIKRAVGKQT